MPAEKTARVQARRRAINRRRRSKARTLLKNAQTALAQGNIAGARSAVASATSALDRAVQSGILHRNNAARRKSGLARSLSVIVAQSAGGQTEAPSSAAGQQLSQSTSRRGRH